MENPESGTKETLPTKKLMEMYNMMVRIRACEERLADLLVKKEVQTPCHLCTGQEAVAAGVCATLNKDDYVFGGHRSHGHYLAKGGDLNAMVAEIYGKKTGCSGGKGGSMHLFAEEVGILGTVPIVAASIPLAVGAALSARIKKENKVSVAFFGDGATDEGTFHESMNLAAHRKLPIIFVCENNFYASHMHVLEHRAKDNINDYGEAHGMASYRLDGNICTDVYTAALESVERARKGEGPSFIECRTFRWRGHVGPSLDIDVGVKRKEDLNAWREKDPIPQLKGIILEQGIEEKELKLIEKTAEEAMTEAVKLAQKAPKPDKSELYDHVYWSKGKESPHA